MWFGDACLPGGIKIRLMGHAVLETLPQYRVMAPERTPRHVT
jgi:hypothetical protein